MRAASSRPGLGQRLERAARLNRARTANALESLGLFAGQERVLAALSGGPLAMSALAEALGVQAPTATKTVARLGAAGLVERVDPGDDETGRHDGRTVRVRLTDAGHERAAAVAGIAATLEAELVAALGERRARRLRKLLRRAERVLAAGRRPSQPAVSPALPPEASGDASTSDTPLSRATTSDSIGT